MATVAEVDLADLGVCGHFCWRAVGDDASPFHDQDPVDERSDHAVHVLDEDQSCAGGGDPGNQVDNVAELAAGEPSGYLVEQDQVGTGGQRPRKF